MLSNTLHNRPVMSLRSGGSIATAIEPIFNPHNLKIIGWWCTSDHMPGRSVLLSEDVREVMPQGLAVNDESAISSPGDLVRHQEILNIRFELIDKLVKTKSHKLGKVSDFTYDDSMFVQKLYVARSLVKLFSSEDTLIIDRRQILEITDKFILVDEADAKIGAEKSVPAGAAIASS